MEIDLNDDAPVQQSSKRNPLGEHPTLKLILAVVAILAFVMPTLYLFEPGWFPPKPAASPTTHVPQPTGGTNPSKELPVLGRSVVGDCLGPGMRIIACREAHAFEVIAKPTDTCDAAALVHYLSGAPDLDILITKPQRVSNGPAAGFCSVQLPSGVSTVVTARDSLTQGREGDPWRRCTADLSVNDRVPCSVPHTGEYIGLPADSTDCVKAFESYALITYQQVSDHLRLARVEPS
ncbi:MAG: hypothetical protein QOE53_1116, partial [Pseudonocardiales bacterium]|nr:hypothetical protein [Pseudonocardiales bacterium]